MDTFISFHETQFDNIFPFYILIKKDLKIISVGKTLEKLFPETKNNVFFEKYYVKRPQIQKEDFDSLLSLSNQMVVLECYNTPKSMLRGQLEYIPLKDQIIFLGSPWFGSMEQVTENNLNLRDFAFHDPMIDLLHVLKTQEITTDDLKQLLNKVSQQKNDLKKAAREIHDIALFPMQNPDPLIRIDLKGNILTMNPAAEGLTSFTYQNKDYHIAEFWLDIVNKLDINSEREVIEIDSANKTYSLVIKPIPESGYFNIYGRDITGQKEKEEQLRILSSIAAENTHGVVIANVKGEVEWANKSFIQMTGFNLEDLAGKKPGHILQGKDSNPETIAYLKNQIYKGEPFICEILNYHKTGRPYWLRIQGQALKDNNGEIIKFFAIEEDITHEKETQQKLKEFESKFRVALERLGDNVWEYDFRTGKTTFSNPPNNFIGFSLKENTDTNKLWWESIYQEDLPILAENDKKTRNGEIDYHVLEYRMVHRDVGIKWVLDRGVVIEKDKDGKPLKIIGTHSDITPQKNAEQALKIKEEKYRNIIANINLGLLEVDTNEIIQYANQRFCLMSGYEHHELLGRKFSEIFLTDVTKNLKKINNQYAADAIELSFIDKSNQHKWWLISRAPNTNDRGDIIGSIGIYLDITEQKTMETDLIKAKNIAETSSRVKEMFLANMSHEIRTPLNAILGMSQQLGKTILNIDQKNYLNIVLTAAENLLIIINDILDISKIEAGKLSLEHIGFEPKIIIDRAMKVMMHRAEEKGISFTNSFYDNQISSILVGDPYRINQILLNIISNAIKFTNKGSVDIRCKLETETETHQTISITVEDTGIGIDKIYVKKMFQKFSQENESITRRYGGTGLGMSISKELVELMNGNIKVESKKGIGTKFIITINFEKGSVNDLPVKESSAIDTSYLLGKKILVADDNMMNRLVAKTILSNYGMLIYEANDGSDALKKIREENFDLILMDVQMPVMDGLEATQIIRKKISKSIPVIALTAFALKGDVDKFLAAGMTDYLSKPYNEIQLLTVIVRWLGESVKSNKTTETFISDETDNIPQKLSNLDFLKELTGGDKSVLSDLLETSIQQNIDFLNQLEEAILLSDVPALKQIIHKMKPALHYIGFVEGEKNINQLSSLTDSNSSKNEMLVIFNEYKILALQVNEELSAELKE